MPRNRTSFDTVLNIRVDTDLRRKLVAIGYLRGEGGEYSGPARDFLLTGAEEFISGLDDRRRARFKEILSNVSISDTFTN